MDGLHEWLQGLRCFTSTPEAARAFQDLRFRFAHSLRSQLTAQHNGTPRIQGPVLYGVYLASIGPLYVGQTAKGERRLGDLPIGESHHLANTFPPEVWERVVVVSWREVLTVSPAIRKAVEQADHAHTSRNVGLGLEYLLQRYTAPLFNARRKTAQGTWQLVDLARSRSKGAVTASHLQPLWPTIQKVWDELASVRPSSVAHVTATGRVVFPSVLRDQIYGPE